MPKFLFRTALLSAIIFLFVFARHSDEDNAESSEAVSVDNQLATEKVAEFLAMFGKLAAPTANVGTFIELLSLSADAFLTTAFPIGSIIAGSLQISTKTESNEYIALANLRDSMQKNSENIRDGIYLAERMIGMESKLDDYANNVRVPLKNLLVHMRKFWDPSVDKSPEAVQIFSKACYSVELTNTPLGILNYIYAHTVEGCKMGLTPVQISLLAKFVPLLKKIRMKFEDQTDNYQFMTSKWMNRQKEYDLTNLFMQLEPNVAGRMLLKIKNLIDTSTFESAQEALSAVKAVIVSTEEDEAIQNSKCLLQDIITGRNYHRRSIEKLQNILRLDTIQLMMYGSFCANVTFKGNSTEIQWFQTEILRIAVQIMDHAIKYVENELEKTFPLIEIGLVKSKIDQMGLTPPVKDNGTIFKTMVEIYSELNQYGNKK
ncbi:hypothetical protein niasHT_012776 [Heterodera trifolii]|uniref:Uncharacterized protein n=1 Tax=Heterodera trifolii TaxID=157864 RepID=A0ABD2LKH9_9BILA